MQTVEGNKWQHEVLDVALAASSAEVKGVSVSMRKCRWKQGIGTIILCVILWATVGFATEECLIVSPLCYTVYQVGETVTLVIGGGNGSEYASWWVKDPLGRVWEDEGREFAFLPEIPGTYTVHAEVGEFSDQITIRILEPSEEEELTSWMQVSLASFWGDLRDISHLNDPFAIDVHGTAPLVSLSDHLVFDVGQPLGTYLLIWVAADVLDDEGFVMESYEAFIEQPFEETTGEVVAVPLYPGATNRICLQGEDEVLGMSAPVYFTVVAPMRGRVPATVFQQAAAPPAEPVVCEEQLKVALTGYIENAKRFSQELAEYLDNVILVPGSGNSTDARTGQIKIGKKGLRDALRMLAKENDPAKRARLEEELKRQMVDTLLHEAGHSKAVRTGQADVLGSLSKQEIANGKDLVKRMIGLLERLNQRLRNETVTLGPDGAGTDGLDASTTFDRARTVILREMRYLRRWLYRSDRAFKEAVRRYNRALNSLKADLAAIRNDGSKSAEDKKTAAEQRVQQFRTVTAADRSTIAEKCGLKYDVELNEDTQTVKGTEKIADSFDGKVIPAKAGS